ncbi:amidase [Acidocella facilis]|jgi:aspartyl-tRNA(Asn)/glutamyl-tRNA(Gln) amidotransferase subunit A|uniref:amidase n=1 Tax=Acidocella facilis TaxID=525 RepID=UPI001F288BC8|nr:amidase [Acidocella facilis]
MDTDFPTLEQLSIALAAGRVTSRQLTEDCLARIADPAGQGRHTFISVDRDKSLVVADAQDRLRKAGAAPSCYAGIPISVKDLFDVAGEVTSAGSEILRDSPPAANDAPAIVRLRQAGFVLIGRTNMSEFAYSGLGINPHYGTPLSVWDREGGRVPGGSSSGAAVSVADGMAYGAIGTDTGGSCRIPAVFNGLVGYKPTARRVPLQGAVPLSSSLDSIGPLARSVSCCAIIDSILAQTDPPRLEREGVAGLNFVVPDRVVLEDLAPPVAAAFEAALSRLSAAGARVQTIAVPEFANELAALAHKGGLSAAEAFAWHERFLTTRSSAYDQRVLARILRGAEQSAGDYIRLLSTRASFIAKMQRRMAAFDALLLPTSPIVAPLLADVVRDEDFNRLNLLSLRNNALVNLMDGCGLSLPIHRRGEAPVGLLLAASPWQDQRLMTIGAAVENALC